MVSSTSWQWPQIPTQFGQFLRRFQSPSVLPTTLCPKQQNSEVSQQAPISHLKPQRANQSIRTVSEAIRIRSGTRGKRRLTGFAASGLSEEPVAHWAHMFSET